MSGENKSTPAVPHEFVNLKFNRVVDQDFFDTDKTFLQASRRSHLIRSSRMVVEELISKTTTSFLITIGASLSLVTGFPQEIVVRL